MKKIITLLLTLCLILSCTAVLAACKEEHVHEFKNEWSGDASHHWHTCSGENCLEVSEKAAHEWRELGGIVSCSVCGASADVATPDEKTWNEAISEQKFDNVTINYEIDVTSAVSYENGVSRDMGQNRQEHVVKIADEGLYRKMNVYIDGSNPQVLERAFGGLDADAQRNLFFKTFLALLAEKDNFVYDSEEGVYIAPAKISVRVEGTEGAYAVETMTNGRIKIDANGNVEYFSCTLDEKSYFDNKLSTQVIGDAVWSFSDYGTTVVDSSLIGDGENNDSENEEPPVQEPDYEDPADDPAVEDPSTEDPDSNDPDVVDPENT